jgi:hypothetical protein
MSKPEATGGEQPKKRTLRVFSAKEKAQAVLSLWSGRRSTSALMQELAVPWGVLHGWEQRAIGGILTALDPGWQQKAEQAGGLPARLERLIEKTLVPKPKTE